MPSLRSILTVTELSWWQNKQVNVVSSGCFLLEAAGAGFLEDFFRLPMVESVYVQEQP